MAFPAGFERGDVHDDAAARIGRLAEADHQDVAGDAEIFDRAGERKAVRRDDADVGFAVDEILRVEFLGIDRGRIDVGEDLEFGGNARVIAIGRSEEHTSELQSLMRISYAVFCLKKQKPYTKTYKTQHTNKTHTSTHYK